MWILNEIKRAYCPSLSTIITTLVRQAARWSSASLQDESPLIAVLHSVYGAGYLWALKDIATENEIRQVVDPKKFEHQIIKAMDQATKKAVRACPQYKGDVNQFLAELAGEG